jgi:hypothetical protein
VSEAPAVRGTLAGRSKRLNPKDALLVSAWVVAYAGVLVVFRMAKALERLRKKPRSASPGRRTEFEKKVVAE